MTVTASADMSNFNQKLGKLAKSGSIALIKALNKSAIMVQGDAIKLLQKGSRSGETYKSHGRQHVASAAGEPPKTDTGNLASNINVDHAQKSGGSIVAKVVSNAAYSNYLENGTRFIEPRPFLAPALEKNKEKIQELIVQTVRDAFKSGA